MPADPSPTDFPNLPNFGIVGAATPLTGWTPESLTGWTPEERSAVDAIVAEERARLDAKYGFEYQRVPTDPRPNYARDRLKGASGD